MNAGELRHYISMQAKTVARDTFGAETITWSTLYSCYAKVEPLMGREYFSSKQVQSEVTHKITIWYKRGFRSDYRILWGTRIYNILSVINPEEKNEILILMCSEWAT